ncbi:hypothetical protein [Vibrio sp. D431a]|uniref:hypothetical protein n=1 Tax=Vibrio sp. D431a TaxID=2837388 RepID=UPI0025566728|nr:hypothetical protein [Vibrio sp. D431a]MDK9793704.1 hypothetical protein [Vibrio sp. D431a]
MSEHRIKRSKPLSMYNVAEMRVLFEEAKLKDNVMKLVEGHWKTGKWEPFVIDADMDFKAFFDQLVALVEAHDPHFKLN